MKRLAPSSVLFVLLVGLTVPGCSSSKHAGFFLPSDSRTESASPKKRKSPPLPTRQQAEEGLLRAIVQRFTDDVAALRKVRPGAIYLSFGSQHLDPDRALLKRIGIPGVQIKPLSAAPTAEATQHAQSKNDVFLEIENIEWLDALDVRATCSWAAADTTRRSFIYEIRWVDKKWLVQ